jgi:FixJ family two-component response regulator
MKLMNTQIEARNARAMKSVLTLKSFAALSFDGDRVAGTADARSDSERARLEPGEPRGGTGPSGRSAAATSVPPALGIDRKLQTSLQPPRSAITRLLVASNDTSVVECVVRALSSKSCVIVRIASSTEAVKHLVRLNPVATVVDLDLPGEEGWNTAERLLARHPAMPLVLLTGRTEDFTLASIIATALVLPKPVNAGRLRQTLEAAMSGSPARQEREQTRQHEMLRYARPLHSPEPVPHPYRHWGLNE